MKRALVVLALAACTADGGTVGSTAHELCIGETNRYRGLEGEAAVVHSQELEDYADEGARFDFSAQPHDHFSSTGGGGIAFAENECPQQGNWRVEPGQDVSAVVADCIKAFYDEGPGGGHFENLIGPYTKLGCGIYQSGDKITIIQDFGN